MSFAINLLMALLVAPLMAGVVRKFVRGLVHSRQGPPLAQPFHDLTKLLGKEDLRTSISFLMNYAPTIVLAAMLAAALLTPMGLPAPINAHGDLVLFVYMLALAAIATIMISVSAVGPYSMANSAAEIIGHFTVEPVMVICLLAAALKAASPTMWDLATWNADNAGSLSMVVAAIALFLALIAQVGKLPFDAPEADTDIMDGPIAALSGPRLAQFQLASLMKQIIYASILAAVFIPWGLGYIFPLNVLVHILKVCVLVVLMGLVDVVNPRLRSEQVMWFFVFVIVLALAALGLAIAGL